MPYTRQDALERALAIFKGVEICHTNFPRLGTSAAATLAWVGPGPGRLGLALVRAESRTSSAVEGSGLLKLGPAQTPAGSISADPPGRAQAGSNRSGLGSGWHHVRIDPNQAGSESAQGWSDSGTASAQAPAGSESSRADSRLRLGPAQARTVKHAAPKQARTT